MALTVSHKMWVLHVLVHQSVPVNTLLHGRHCRFCIKPSPLDKCDNEWLLELCWQSEVPNDIERASQQDGEEDEGVILSTWSLLQITSCSISS
jgi:hypothetical protein